MKEVCALWLWKKPMLSAQTQQSRSHSANAFLTFWCPNLSFNQIEKNWVLTCLLCNDNDLLSAYLHSLFEQVFIEDLGHRVPGVNSHLQRDENKKNPRYHNTMIPRSWVWTFSWWPWRVIELFEEEAHHDQICILERRFWKQSGERIGRWWGWVREAIREAVVARGTEKREWRPAKGEIT